MANGVFDWIRDGVRKSILLGVSDAFEQIGTPEHEAEFHPQLAGALRSSATKALAADAAATVSTPRIGGATATATKPERRRLGRSLSRLNAEQGEE